MKIAGFEKTSFIELPGKVSSIIFTQGCNYKCVYCHNYELIPLEATNPLISEEEILSYLQKRKGLVDAVTVTGGEATLQPDLKEFLKKVKAMNYFIKIDTNGSNPGIVKELIDEKLVDYVAMDIKASLEKYDDIVQMQVNKENIKKSVKLLMDFGSYEFRTTVYPSLTADDFHKIGELIKGANIYFIQQFRNKETLAASDVEPYKKEKLFEFAGIMKNYVKKVEVRGI